MSVDLLESLALEYRGRIPKRVDGVQRRDEILAAAESIIVKYGIQGVKHRAVAELADVPLAATTYYFEDLSALLHDVFVNFTQRNLVRVAALEEMVLGIIYHSVSADTDEIPDLSLLDNAQRQALFGQIANLIFKHVLQQVNDRHDRLIERAFANEALRNKEIAEIVNAIEIKQLDSIAELFKLLGSESADSDAKELLAVILFLEHRLLTGVVNKKEAKQTISKTVERLAGLA